ncbi:MAG: anhydro-N-acetylmuramic acid kinase [Sphingobacteriia bacterium]|nr:anhydro-N-acetylmuramic acid kinase [Sphingobacteriia bacterium]
MQKFKILGTMSGTSFDGVDLAFIETDGEQIFELGNYRLYEYPESIKQTLKCQNLSIKELLCLEKEISEFYVKAIIDYKIQEKREIDLIGFHGQTIIHIPRDSLTLQIGNPSLIAAKTKIGVIADLRRFDMALGGQGAPIVPVYHKALFKKQIKEPFCVLNIGGVANLTYIDDENIIAFDTGPGSALIDDYILKFFNKPYDNEGKIARSAGFLNMQIPELTSWLDDEYFYKSYPKSLDREHWHNLVKNTELNGESLIAVLTEFTALTIEKAINLLPNKPARIITCGGGRKNKFMMERIEALTSINVENIDSYNLNGDAIEAQAIGFIAARIKNGLEYTYPTTTGVTQPVGGGAFYQPW